MNSALPRVKYGVTAYIYTLSDPISGEVRYIGKTSNPRARLVSHLRDMNRINHKRNWIKSLLDQGLEPIMEIIDERPQSDVSDWEELEEFYIRYLKFLGCNLTNISIGSCGGYSKTPFTIQKLSEAAKNRSHDSNQKIADSLRGRRLPDHVKKKLSETRSSPDFLQRNPQVSRKGYKFTPEQRAKLSEVNKGRIHTLETRKKMSQSRIGIQYSPETIQKMKDAPRLSGWNHKEETRDKMTKAKRLGFLYRAAESILLRGDRTNPNPIPQEFKLKNYALMAQLIET